jgi:hypothetical protein
MLSLSIPVQRELKYDLVITPEYCACLGVDLAARKEEGGWEGGAFQYPAKAPGGNFAGDCGVDWEVSAVQKTVDLETDFRRKAEKWEAFGERN